MAWTHWCMIWTSQPWGKTRASTTFWIDVSSSHPLMVLWWCLPLGPCVFRPTYIYAGFWVTASVQTIGVCWWVSPNKEAFINGWWPTWCLSPWLLFHSLARWGNPPKRYKTPDNLIDLMKPVGPFCCPAQTGLGNRRRCSCALLRMCSQTADRQNYK